jgi:hypothetical protein
MKKNLDLLLVRSGLKKVTLSERADNVYHKWSQSRSGSQEDFYKSLLKISSGHESLYKKREACEARGHNEEVLSITSKELSAKCKSCGLQTSYDPCDGKFVDNSMSLSYSE